MKKITLFSLLVVLGLFIVHSQNVDTSMAAAINNVFSPLEKNRIPHNILLDYGYDNIDVPNYDGVLRTENYMSIGAYKEIYNAMVSSCTATNVAGIFSPQQEHSEWASLQRQTNLSNIVYTLQDKNRTDLYFKRLE